MMMMMMLYYYYFLREMTYTWEGGRRRKGGCNFARCKRKRLQAFLLSLNGPRRQPKHRWVVTPDSADPRPAAGAVSPRARRAAGGDAKGRTV